MPNFSNNSYDPITDKRSVPFNQSGTGTIGTQTVAVEGVGTLFLSEMIAGSILVDLDSWEWRKVVRVDSDILAYIEKPFTVDLAPGTTPEIIPHTISRVKEISLSGTGLLENKAFSGILTLSKASNEDSGRRGFVDPVIIDATGNQIKVDLLY